MIRDSETKPDSRKALAKLSTPENSKTPEISVSSESILAKIKKSLDGSTVGGALFNARANLFTCLNTLAMNLDLNKTDKIEKSTVSTLAALTLLSLCNDRQLLDSAQVDTGLEPISSLKEHHQDYPINEKANSIKISNTEMYADVSFQPNPKNSDEITGILAHYQIPGDLEKTITITLNEPLNMKQIRDDALAYILEKQKNITHPN